MKAILSACVVGLFGIAMLPTDGECQYSVLWTLTGGTYIEESPCGYSFQNAAVVSDFDGDGRPEIAFATSPSGVTIVDAATGVVEFDFQPPIVGSNCSPGLVGVNIDSDPELEIVLECHGTAGPSIYLIDGHQSPSPGSPGVSNESAGYGVLWSTTSNQMMGPLTRMPKASLAQDIDGDGRIEIIAHVGNIVVIIDALTGYEEYRFSPTCSGNDGVRLISRAPEPGFYVCVFSITNTCSVSVIGFSGPVGVADGLPSIPFQTHASPVPSRGPVTIFAETSVGGPLVVRVFDTTGRLLRELTVSDAAIGTNQINWDGRDGQGREVPSGIYFYEATLNEVSAGGKRVVVVR